jgi:hypothetical protein
MGCTLRIWHTLATVTVLAAQPSPPHPSVTHLLVMPAVVDVLPNSGNVGRDFVRIRSDVTARIVSALRERFPDVRVADTSLPIAVPLADYRAAVAGARVSGDEFHAAADARKHGATHLLVPVVTQWTQMRTDDPIGVFTLPRDQVTVTLRLMQLQPAAVAATATFHNQGLLTLNRDATRLLDGGFRRTVLQLVGG